MYIILVRMLTSTLGRHIDDGSFQQLQQSLLNTFTTDITGYRGVVTLTGYLVYLVDKDDTPLGCF